MSGLDNHAAQQDNRADAQMSNLCNYAVSQELS